MIKILKSIIQKKLNGKYYAIVVDAETETPITLRYGRTPVFLNKDKEKALEAANKYINESDLT